MKRLSWQFGDHINKKILISILLFSSLLTLFFTAYRLYEDYQQDLKFIHSQLSSINSYVSPIISRGLWIFDDELINIQMNSIGQLPYIHHVEVRDPVHKLLFQVGPSVGSADLATITSSLEYFDEKNQRHFMGILILYADYTPVYRELTNRVLVVLYTEICQTFLVSLFILGLVHHLISRHLFTITNQLQPDTHNPTGFSDLNSKPAAIKLNRPKELDELELLVNTLNQYRTNIFESFQLVRSKQKDLEKENQARTSAERNLLMQNTLLNAIFDAVDRSILVVDNHTRIVRVNKDAEQRLNRRGSDLADLPLSELLRISPAARDRPSSNNLDLFMQANNQQSYDGFCQFMGQEEFPATLVVYPLFSEGERMGSALFINDETTQNRLAEISYHATHDYLTGTFNRYYFDSQLEKLLARTTLLDQALVVGLLDLDAFKTINDLFGHAKGDEVLIHVAKVLRDQLGVDAIIARQGGDEFIFAVPGQIKVIQDKTLHMLKTLESVDFHHEKDTFHISASVGLAPVQIGVDNLSSAVSKADIGCYNIKSDGGNNVKVIQNKEPNKNLNIQVSDYNIISNLRQAIEQDSIILYLQSIFPLNPKEHLPIREEVLFRLVQDNKLILPDQVLPSLERGRFVYLLDQFVIRKVDGYARAGTIDNKHLNINLSPISLSHWDMQQAALHLLESCNTLGISVCFEVTENTLISNLSRVKTLLKSLKVAGAKLAIDDFGKGYASYGYLDNLDIDMIKIDGSLVTKMAADPKTKAVISSIQSIADSIGAQTVAEHARTENDLGILRDIGINYAQCFLLGRPRPFIDSKTQLEHL